MAQTKLTTVGNPFMPLWEHIPDGEPYVFEDPDQPGKYRVYVYGSHDDLISEYCGRDQVVWSASVDSLNNWRYDGVILVVDKNANGEPFDAKGTADVLYAPDVTLVTDSTGKKTYYLFPNDQTGARNGLIAKSDRPDGPFEVCNWSKDNPNRCSSTQPCLLMTTAECMAIGDLSALMLQSLIPRQWQRSSLAPRL